MDLRKLPKDLLLEIIVKQNQIDHLGNEECLELIQNYKDKIRKNLAIQFREFFKIPSYIHYEKFHLKCNVSYQNNLSEIYIIDISLDRFNLEKCISLVKNSKNIVVADHTRRDCLEYCYQRHWELVEGFDIILNHINKNPLASFEFLEKLFYQMGKGNRTNKRDKKSFNLKLYNLKLYI